MRPELLEHTPEPRRDLPEIQLGVDLDFRDQVVFLDGVANGDLHPFTQLRHVLHRKRQPGSEGVATEALEQVLALRQCGVDGKCP